MDWWFCSCRAAFSKVTPLARALPPSQVSFSKCGSPWNSRGPGLAADVLLQAAAQPAQAFLLDQHEDRGADVDLVRRRLPNLCLGVDIEDRLQLPGTPPGGLRPPPQGRHTQHLAWVRSQDLEQGVAVRQADAAGLTDRGKLGLLVVVEDHSLVQ